MGKRQERVYEIGERGMAENAEPAFWMKHQRLCIIKPPSNMFDWYSKVKIYASQQSMTNHAYFAYHLPGQHSFWLCI
jgi:hypothetical protein